MTEPIDLVALLREARQELSMLCYSGRCCTIRERIDTALAQLTNDRWTLASGRVEADLGNGWRGDVSAYDGRFPWSVGNPQIGEWAVGIADTFEAAKAAAEKATRGEE